MFCILCYVILCYVVLSCVVLCMYVCPSSIYKSDMPWNELETPRFLCFFLTGTGVWKFAWPHDLMTPWPGTWWELEGDDVPAGHQSCSSETRVDGAGIHSPLGPWAMGLFFAWGWDSYGLMHPEHPKTTSSHREPKHGKVFPQGQEHNCAKHYKLWIHINNVTGDW